MKQIIDAMETAKNTTVVYQEQPAFCPTLAPYAHIKAVTFDGLPRHGAKTKIFAYLGFPEGAKEPLPAVVLIPGGDGHPYLEWVRLWNDRGYAAIVLDTGGCFPRAVNVGQTEVAGDSGNWLELEESAFAEEGYTSPAPRHAFPTTETSLEEHWAYYAISAVILAGNVLRQDERVDSAKLGVVGISWGGTLTAQTIGIDNRFAFAVPIYGMAYLGGPENPFANMDVPYANECWGAERYLDGADMPILWLGYNDDSAFTVPEYVKSYQKTEGKNEKNVLLMLGDWSHSHTAGWSKPDSYRFADWVVSGRGGFVTFLTQPSAESPACRLRVPEGVSELRARLYYITKPMTYSKHVKNGIGPYVFLDQVWQTDDACLTVDAETGTVGGALPDGTAGYYIQVFYTADGEAGASSSVYRAVK